MRVNPQRMTSARLTANMSRADLAAALRRVTNGRLKASERGIRGWEKGEYRPSADVIPAYALATGRPLDFFYQEDDGSDDDEDDDLPSVDEALRLVIRRMFQEERDKALKETA